MTFDVIVLGAGPAGSTAAYRLASSHLKVLLLDQRQFPRYKPCGGGLPIRTLAEFPFDVTSVLEFSAETGKVSFRGQPWIDTVFQHDYAWLADRTRLDAFLLQKARESGAQCLTGVRVDAVQEQADAVQARAGGRVYTARWLIGADGVNSVTAKSLNLLRERPTGTAIEAELAVPVEVMRKMSAAALFDFGALRHGYGWIFSKKDHVSVGVYQAKPGNAAGLRDRLNEFIVCQPLLQEHRILHLQGHRIPLGGQSGPLHTRRCLLAGDAANLADPWLGEGVYYAVRSARLAAEAILRLSAGELTEPSSYTRRILDEIGADFRYARRIARMVYRFPRISTRLLRDNSTAREIIFDKVRGDLSFEQAWHKLVRLTPVLMLQAVFGTAD